MLQDSIFEGKEDKYYCSKCGKEVLQTSCELNAHEVYCTKFENVCKTVWGKFDFNEPNLEIKSSENIYGFFIEKE